jgi:hypothetical protein
MSKNSENNKAWFAALKRGRLHDVRHPIQEIQYELPGLFLIHHTARNVFEKSDELFGLHQVDEETRKSFISNWLASCRRIHREHEIMNRKGRHHRRIKSNK